MVYTRCELGEGCFGLKRMGWKSRIEMKHAGSRALHAVWAKLRGERDAPYRAEITSGQIGEALSAHMFILESLSPGAFRVRQAGPALYDIFGMEIRGMGAEAIIEGESRARFLALADDALEQCGAAVAQGVMTGGAEEAFETVLLPLRSDFGRIDRLLGAVHLADESAQFAARRGRVQATGLLEGALPAPKRAEPLPGFAEPASAFGHKRSDREGAPLESLTGGGAGRSRRRRGHLKLVKD